MQTRRQQAQEIRNNAAELAASRPHPVHRNNGEEYKYRRLISEQTNEPSHIANFTKGLPHDPKTGLLLNSTDYKQFILGIQSGDTDDFAKTPLGPALLPDELGCLSIEKITCENVKYLKFCQSKLIKKLEEVFNPTKRADYWEAKISQKAENGEGAKVRAWESAGAGLTFDLEGVDAQAVTMPPAPTLESVELAAEMGEVYLQALLRDVHFSQLRTGRDKVGAGSSMFGLSVEQAKDILNSIQIEGKTWFNANCCDLNEDEQKRDRPTVTLQNIFRGVAPGDNIGPYLSQFLLIGNQGLDGQEDIANGMISYGSIRIDQKVRVATPEKDYMTTFEAWVDVQNGADVRGLETYENKPDGTPVYRFITTPRDLATYVHYDALYEAYLNAALIMLSMGVPFDPGIPFQQPDVQDKQQGFAQFGGPQILTLVCEVATRALKAVRYQKFNIHRRLRPEALAGLIDRYKQGIATAGELKPIGKLVASLATEDLLTKVKQHNAYQNSNDRNYPDCRDQDVSAGSDNYFLPMAFPEGSPMHPSYGAGHATVAGACVTVLKAFFDHGYELNLGKQGNQYICYEPNADGSALKPLLLDSPLTIEGELNKIAANISIGRDWAGVHYFTDYIESLRLGEQIAISILEEQKLTYGENFTMTIPLFDGDAIRI